MNNKFTKKRAWLILLPVLVIFLFSFQSCRSGASSNDIQGVATTIEPIRYFVDRLTGDAVQVNVMVPQGASPATYSPTPGQMRSLSDAKLYLQVGYLGFEQAWMNQMNDLNPEMNVVNLSEELILVKEKQIDHGDHVHVGGVDPHIWMSPMQVRRFLPILKKALIASWPELVDSVSDNYDELMTEISMRHEALKLVSQKVSTHKFMIFHPALTYLARDYGFEQFPIEFEGKEPSPAALKRLIDLALEEEIHVIFIQEEFDKRNAQLVNEAAGAQLVVINPLRYNWLEEIDYITQLLGEYLK